MSCSHCSDYFVQLFLPCALSDSSSQSLSIPNGVKSSHFIPFHVAAPSQRGAHLATHTPLCSGCLKNIHHLNPCDSSCHPIFIWRHPVRLVLTNRNCCTPFRAESSKPYILSWCVTTREAKACMNLYSYTIIQQQRHFHWLVELCRYFTSTSWVGIETRYEKEEPCYFMPHCRIYSLDDVFMLCFLICLSS